MYGTKSAAETADAPFRCVVGERSIVGRSSIVRLDGRNRSEYASISSDKLCEKHGHRKSKVS